MSWPEPWAAEIKLAPKSVRKRHSLSLLQAERTEAPAFYRGLLIDKYDQSGRSLRAFGAMAQQCLHLVGSYYGVIEQS